MFQFSLTSGIPVEFCSLLYGIRVTGVCGEQSIQGCPRSTGEQIGTEAEVIQV